MRIYFTASVSAKENSPELQEKYEQIVNRLEELGHEVMGEHVLELSHEEIKDVDDDKRLAYYRSMLEKINRADLVFAELSYSSASIGHEVTLALEKNKPLIIASEVGRTPQIFKAMREHDIYFLEYEGIEDLLDRLPEELENVKEGEDIRFNFLIPPSMVDYLEWISKSKRVPKSVYLRGLIRNDMENNSDYGIGEDN